MSDLISTLGMFGIVPVNVVIASNNAKTHKHFMRSYRPEDVTEELIKGFLERAGDVQIAIQLKATD